ncbi:MAG: ROK family protein [Lachnospiraceae bacterium]|nr:ROK family protein [Lachnospiraceae bacterium]
MKQKVGVPNTIKKINEALIREKFMKKEPLSCAIIVAETGISITTVRTIVNEMLNRGELISLGLGDTSIGRPSEFFIINDDCYQGISICICDGYFYVLTMNIHARIIEFTKVTYNPKVTCNSNITNSQNIIYNTGENLEYQLTEIIESRFDEKTRAIGIGVPGVVSDNGFIQNIREKNDERVDFVTALQEKFSVPIILENDLNASALGFAKAAGTDKDNSTLAFINFIGPCKYFAAGFAGQGEIIRGMGNYAGELGLMPYDARHDFSEVLFDSDEAKRSEILARLLSWVCCTINPKQVVLCADADFKINSRKINKLLAHHLPGKMIPKLLVSNDYEQFYMEGMALLTCTQFY